MKPGTVIDAAIASAILFVGALVTLFQQNPDLLFSDISQGTWVAMGGTALLSFLKAYQTLSIRRALNRNKQGNT